MIALPKSPEGPTVYVLGAAPPEAETAVVAAGLRALGATPAAVTGIAAGPVLPEGDRRRFLDFLLDEYNARAVLLAAHGGAFLAAGGAGYDSVDEACALIGEVGVIHRRPGALAAVAPRLAAAARAADAVLPADLPEALVLGAGPDAAAVAAALAGARCTAVPGKVTLASVDAKTLTDLRGRIAGTPLAARMEVRHVDGPGEHDRLLALLPPGSAVIAALGGDARRTVSPVGGAALFPEGGTVWDLHARDGRSALLGEAARQRTSAGLTLHDGRAYDGEHWAAALFALAEAPDDEASRAKLEKALDGVRAG